MLDQVCSLAVRDFPTKFCRAAKARFAAVLVLAVLLGGLGHAAAQAQPAQSAQTPAQTGQGPGNIQAAPIQTLQPGMVRIVPFGRNASPIKNTLSPAGAHLDYWGGPVISQVHVVAVFWGTHVNAAITAPGTIDQFFRDITSSRYYDLLTEYSTVGVTGSGVPAASSNQSINRGVFDTSVTITPSVCNVTPPATCTIDDTAIQTELTNQLAAGHLPVPVSDAQGNVESFYMIYFPPGVSITVGSPPVGSCVTGGFCAYHSDTPAALVPYGVQPDFAQGGCSAGCGTGTLFQKITAVTSHELSEAVTDAQVGTAQSFGPPLAWYDPNPATGGTGALGEIGDICSGQEVTVTAGVNTYSVQQEFSNLQNDCVSAPPVFQVSGPASAVQGAAANVTLTVQSSVNASTLTSYLGTVHLASSDGLAVLPADYTFVAADAGTHTFPVTLNTTGSQTITATDTRAAGFVGSASISVTGAPDLTVSKTHTGNFTQSQSGTYTITVSNIGQGPTSAKITATDSLPTGLTATTISGTGWTCTLVPLACTRSDALAAGAAYPAITLNVNVAANAPASVTNSVTVTGGGELNTANDTATDLTTIIPAVVDLTTAVTNQGPYFQGQTGATYLLSVNNVGTLASSGTVTLTGTLPAGLTATALSGTGWTCTVATITCTRADSVNPGASYPSITLTFNVAPTANGTLTGSVAVSGGGDANAANNTGSLSTLIQPAITFTPGASNLTVTAGQAASFAFQANLQASAGTVSFNCSGLPAAAACSFSPASASSTTQVTTTITTTARALTFFNRFGEPGRLPPAMVPVLLMIAVLISMRALRGVRLKPAMALGGLVLLGALAGCGGGSNPPPVVQNPTGTPAGTYSVTITGTGSNAITATQTITLVVR